MAGLCEGGNEPPGSLKARQISSKAYSRVSPGTEPKPVRNERIPPHPSPPVLYSMFMRKGRAVADCHYHCVGRSVPPFHNVF
ncbi:hypothetical protein ANN_04917 [Periplaneta americana]|uniref:Uncharacterized protein n=1 Tax=Periplaneta americana TaxID=6978 RepID=A0ABQ8T9P9_PERAM|nr:hypothetical protein ANN_04917 [Periplaneta americana]